MPTLIRETARAGAGEADHIAVQTFSPREVLTALRNGSGDLELIMWYADSLGGTLARGPDSGTQAGTIDEVALTLLGRRAITAVRNGSGDLLVIPWKLETDGTLVRSEYVDAQAGEASQIAIAPVTDTMVVTAVRSGSGRLLLIPWCLDPNDKVLRLNHENPQGNPVSVVTIAPFDDANVLTAVRNGSDQLELTGWRISADGDVVSRWPIHPTEGLGGDVSEIALAALPGSGPIRDVVTAVRNGSGNLQVIVWRMNLVDLSITRIAESEAGEASEIAICSTVTSPSGRSTILVSMRNGDGNLEIIAFVLIARTVGPAVLIRTGDTSDADVTGTAVANLEPGRFIAAIRADDKLNVRSYRVEPITSTLIRPIAEATADPATEIRVQSFNPDEAVVALSTGWGDLQLIGWQVAAQDFTIARGADSAGQAGAAQEVALALVDRRAVTAVRSGAGKLLLISWDVPVGLGSITRVHETGSAAGEADQITLTVVGGDLLVTAVRNGSGNLLLIVWRLEPDGLMSRLNHENAQAGEVSLVSLATLDTANVVTAVRNGSGHLEVIGWRISTGGAVHRWAGQGDAGDVSEIAIATLPGDGPTRDVVTVVRDGSDNLLVIVWRLSLVNQTIQRLADSGGLAGAASDISVCVTSSTPSARPTIVASMSRGSGNLELISFVLVPDSVGGAALVRTGDASNRADTFVRDTALTSLEPGRVLLAGQFNGVLQLGTYAVSDAAVTPAPASILELRFDRLGPPVNANTSWAKSDGTYPLDQDFEWAQVGVPSEEYDDPTLVMGASGWIVAPEDSGADVPFSHPFGFDWEFGIVLDEPSKGLLSPANAQAEEGGDNPNHNTIALADQLGFTTPEGLLGLEWDKGLLPQSYRAQVNHGDRVAVLGRWILDNGHEVDPGYYRTEIHPPLLLASASVQKPQSGSPLTRVLFMSRPYLSGQTYSTDLANLYKDGVADDGALIHHIWNEVKKVLTWRSTMVEIHPKIKEKPFRGTHRTQFVVRTPTPRPSAGSELAVSFRFAMRTPCRVTVAPTGSNEVTVTIELNESIRGREYVPPELPARREVTYSIDELDLLSPGEGFWLSLAESAVTVLSGALPWGGYILLAYVREVLARGLKTDEYDKLEEIDILDTTNAVLDKPISQVAAGEGILTDDNQKYPVVGWLEVYWKNRRTPKPPLTPENFNRWIEAVISDPSRAQIVKKKGWMAALPEEFDLTREQARNLSRIPAEYVAELQRAADLVVDRGGTIRVERESEAGPGSLTVQPNRSRSMELSIGVYHCRFDAHCRHWRCGWGPAR